MKKLPLILLLLALPALPLLAQKDCGNGLPCGPLPWTLPNFPILTSPTPMPTVNASNFIPTDISGAVPTPTPTLDTSAVTDNLATLGAVMSATPMVVLDMYGTPYSQEDTFAELGSNAGTFFGLARAIISPGTFGVLWPLMAFAVVSLTVVLAVKTLTYTLPIFAALFGFIRKMIQVILDFIPL